jgi:CRP-like cAMP-binding protein
MKNLLERLQQSPFFEPLSKGSLNALVAAARRASYLAASLVFQEGETSQGLFWLESGALKAVKYSTQGREQIIHLVKPGQTFNEVGAFTTLPNPATVVALEASEVWHIPGSRIRAQIQADPAFAQQVIDVLSQRLRRSVDLIEDLSLRPVISRLARLLLDEAEDGVLFRPGWYTQTELAARLGTVTDVLQRALRKLEGQGSIAVERQAIKILDSAGLEDQI